MGPGDRGREPARRRHRDRHAGGGHRASGRLHLRRGDQRAHGQPEPAQRPAVRHLRRRDAHRAHRQRQRRPGGASVLPANDVKEFIALAKAKPGTISWASLGVGTGGHITGELLRKKAGIEVIHVPFNGSSAAYRDILPGRVPVGFVVLESALPHVKAGKLKLLALTDRRRNKLHPQVPTVAETVPGVGFESVFGLIGPRGLPPEIVKAINADVVKVLSDPEVHKRLEEQSMEVVASSPAEFASVIRREVEYWRQAVKESGAHVN
ncbi:hypothetical protein HK414_26155 [Ramlibacter terrae]|uniref:Tripartite tricarboxylate transporter substrate binding protein n=1 Tax=Ramlibacter terrae TaxID=2732511 RepID=A0ABX6P5T3_9BURK|nr:hypothetical protein HK414_26155 [Ramlibacter terrae]